MKERHHVFFPPKKVIPVATRNRTGISPGGISRISTLESSYFEAKVIEVQMIFRISSSGGFLGVQKPFIFRGCKGLLSIHLGKLSFF